MANICPCTFGNSLSKALFNLRDAKKGNSDSPEEIASATLLSRRVRRTNEITAYQESPWLYLAVFRLENGEEKELKTTEETYGTLQEGTCGTLAWKGEVLVSFC